MKDQVNLASAIATKAHEGQFRWDGVTPYIAHPAAVALAVRNAGYNDDAIAAAYLHDVIEDTPVTIADLRVQGVNETVLTAVHLLTKLDSQEYLEYLLRLKRNEIARVVKIEDIKHNRSSLDRKRKKSQYEKYTLALHILGWNDPGY